MLGRMDLARFGPVTGVGECLLCGRQPVCRSAGSRRLHLCRYSGLAYPQIASFLPGVATHQWRDQ